MISPNTPPGTRVVVIDASPGPYGDSHLVQGEVVTVSRIVACVTRGWAVVLEEVDPQVISLAPLGQVWLGYYLSRFRLYEEPRVLEREREMEEA